MLSLAEISDRLEINDLLVRYCDAVDAGTVDDFDDIFTTDAVIDYSNFGGPKGGVALIKGFLRENLGTLPKQHLIANVTVRVDGDEAVARCICLNPQGFPADDTADGYQIAFFGLWYEDLLIRTDGRWRIRQRTSLPGFTHNLPH